MSKRNGRRAVIAASVLATMAASALIAPAQAQTLDRVKTSTALKLGYDPDARPFSFNSEQGRPDGYAVALCNKIADSLRAQLNLSKLDVEYHVNGVVTTRKFLKSNEDTVRRFLRAYIEGAVRGMKDKAFAMKSMGKYFRTDDHEVLEETYEMVIKNGFNVPPYPAGIQSLLLELEKTVPKAKTAKPEEFADSRLVRELDQSGFIKSLLVAR